MTATRPLKLWCHSFGYAEGISFETHSGFLAWCREAGLPVQPTSEVFETLEEVDAYTHRWEGDRHSVDWEIDGVVVNGSARAVDLVAGLVRRVQSGYLYHYAFAMILGLIGLLAVLIRYWR